VGVIAVTMPGGSELVIILLIVLLLFGAKRLPELAGSIGRSIKEFRRSAETEDGGAGGSEEASGSGSDGTDDRA
jgi:sec-independent protein translocase protein TatA